MVLFLLATVCLQHATLVPCLNLCLVVVVIALEAAAALLLASKRLLHGTSSTSSHPGTSSSSSHSHRCRLRPCPPCSSVPRLPCCKAGPQIQQQQLVMLVVQLLLLQGSTSSTGGSSHGVCQRQQPQQGGRSGLGSWQHSTALLLLAIALLSCSHNSSSIISSRCLQPGAAVPLWVVCSCLQAGKCQLVS